jgi:hypothetical protein
MILCINSEYNRSGVGKGQEINVITWPKVVLDGLVAEPAVAADFTSGKLPNQCLTKSPPYLTFLTVIEAKISLILGNLLISGIYFQNPAYRLIR